MSSILIPISIGKAQSLISSVGKVGAEALVGGITKGSADQAAKGDIDYLVEGAFNVAVDVNRPKLMGTALVAGSIYGMIITKYYRKLKMSERIVISSEVLKQVSASMFRINDRMRLMATFGDELKAGPTIARYEELLSLLNTQMAIIRIEMKQLDAWQFMIQQLNKAVGAGVRLDVANVKGLEMETYFRGIGQRSIAEQLEAVRILNQQTSVAGLDPADLATLKEIFQMETDNVMGLKGTINSLRSYSNTLDTNIRNAQAITAAQRGEVVGQDIIAASQGQWKIPSAEKIRALGAKAGGSISLMVTNTLDEFANISPKVRNIISASTHLSELAASTRRRVGVVVGKAFLYDSIIWGVTLGVDLGLNLFMSEEEQANIPVIGFLFEGAGWSPLGWAIESVLNQFIPDETRQSLFDMFIAVLLAASEQDTLADGVLMILDFYIDNVSYDLLVPLAWDYDIGEIQGLLFPLKPPQDPLVILQVASYLIAYKLVFTLWVLPAFHYLNSAIKS